jgi:hypothetical protein
VYLDGSVSGKKNLTYEVTITVLEGLEVYSSPVEVSGDWSNGDSSTCMTVSGTCNVTLITKDIGLTFSVITLSGNNIDYGDLPSITPTKTDGGGTGDGGGNGKPCNPRKEPCPS